MRTSISTAALIVTIALALGCSSTRIVDTWQAPHLTASDLKFEHVVAIAITQKSARRSMAEDSLARAATRTRVSPAYTLLNDDERGNVERVRMLLTAARVDGAIVVRLLGAEEKQTYVPGRTYHYGGGFYGYYGRAGAVVYDPGYVRTDTILTIETSLHDVARGELLWAAISESLNPSSVDELMTEIAEAAGNALRDAGLVP